MNNTRMILKAAVAITLIGLFVSCAPSSSNNDFGSSLSANIIGGVNSSADYEKQNGIVGLMTVVQDTQGQQMSFICTGSLIDQNVVLTAAHCITIPQNTKLLAAIVFFGTSLDQVMNEVNQKDLTHVRSIDKIARHESYLKGRGTNNDIGLVHFKGAMPDGFQVAQLAPASMARTLRKGSAVTLAGFGVSSYKIDPSTKQPVGSGDGTLRQISGIKILSVTATNQEMTLDQSNGNGACHGDSGGPAYLVDNVSRKTLLVGVTSRGSGSVLCDRQAIYTDVMGYSQWIADNTKKVASVTAN